MVFVFICSIALLKIIIYFIIFSLISHRLHTRAKQCVGASPRPPRPPPSLDPCTLLTIPYIHRLFLFRSLPLLFPVQTHTTLYLFSSVIASSSVDNILFLCSLSLSLPTTSASSLAICCLLFSFFFRFILLIRTFSKSPLMRRCYRHCTHCCHARVYGYDAIRLVHYICLYSMQLL